MKITVYIYRCIVAPDAVTQLHQCSGSHETAFRSAIIKTLGALFPNIESLMISVQRFTKLAIICHGKQSKYQFLFNHTLIEAIIFRINVPQNPSTLKKLKSTITAPLQ